MMMVVHELGHIALAWLTDGAVQQVILHPLAISSTEVFPNPMPLLVVWAGPIVGCSLPLVLPLILPRSWSLERKSGWFFAGFCLIANGCYIGFGAFERIGDCNDMLEAGTPFVWLLVFGAITVPLGVFIWHRLGSVSEFASDSDLVKPTQAAAMASILLAIILTELYWSFA